MNWRHLKSVEQGCYDQASKPTNILGTTEVTTRFGAVLRSWRSRLGISQEELAGRAGLHRTYVSDVERGTRNVSLASIDKLATALEVSVAKLFEEVGKGEDRGADVPGPGSGDLVDILYVEDRQDDIDLTLHALRTANLGNRIYVVRDGVQALDFLFARGTYCHRRNIVRPQLILLDLGLPKIDGFEVLRQIRSEPRTSNIPVIILTASPRDRDSLASRQLGAQAYIVKPVIFQSLSEVIPKINLQWALVR